MLFKTLSIGLVGLTIYATSHAQQYACIDTVLVAGFGLDGELYSNDTVVGGDDWFADSATAGNLGVIGITAATAMPPLQISANDFRNLMVNAVTYADRNLTYGQRMAVPAGTVRPLPNGGTAVLLDAFWKRDNLQTDSTFFAGTCRVTSNPLSGWNIIPGPANQHNDFADFACHLRREYDSLNQPRDLWMISDFIHGETRSYTSYDILMFRGNPSLDTATGYLIGTGDAAQGGQVPFEFNQDGTISSHGNFRLSVNYDFSNTNYGVFIWTGFTGVNSGSILNTIGTFNQLPSRPFNLTGTYDSSDSTSGYYWVEIETLDSAGCGLQLGNGSPSLGPPFGAASRVPSILITDSIQTLTAESALNLTRYGLVPQACDTIIGAVMLTDRSSTSFNALLKEAIGPIPFGNFPELSAEAGPTAYLDCNHPTISLTGSTIAPYAQPLWTTMDGHIVSGDTSFTLTVDSPGTYYLQVSDPLLSSCVAIDSVIVSRVPASAIPTISVNGNLLESSQAFSYQWYLDGQPIPGADSQQYQALVNGDYQVQATDSFGCSSLSSIMPIFSTGTFSPAASAMNIYPNPASSVLYLERLPASAQQVTLEDLSGRIVQSVTVSSNDQLISFELKLSKGIYLVRCLDVNGKTLAVRKVVAG